MPRSGRCFIAAARKIRPVYMTLDSEFPAQFPDKVLVLIRLDPSQAVVYMNNLSMNRSFPDLFCNHHRQGHAVCPAGKTDQKIPAFRQADSFAQL